MKTYLLKLSLVAFLTFSITSCGNDDGGNSEPQPTFGVSINGQAFGITSVPSAQISNSNRYLIITASNVNTSEIVTITVGTSSGTANELMETSYNIDDASDTNLSYFDGTNGYQANDNGQITITALDTENRTISGTFRGTVAGSFGSSTTYALSNGLFTNIPYSVE